MKYHIRKLKNGHLQLFAVDPSGVEEYKYKCLAYRPRDGVWTLYLATGPRWNRKDEGIDVTKEEATMILFSCEERA